MTSAAFGTISSKSKFRTVTAPLAIAVFVSAAVVALFALHPLGVSGDYPNHLARTWIEAQIGASAELARYYEVAYGFVPDMAMDLVVPPLSQAIGIYPAGAVLICVAALVAPWAGYRLSRQLQGERGGVFAAFGFLTIFSFAFEAGFLNFLLSTGFALLAFSFWTAIAPGMRRAFIFAPVSLALVVSHALGFLLFGYLVLLWELGAFCRGERGAPAQFVASLATRASLAVAPGLAFLAMALLGGGDSVLRIVDAPTDFLASRGTAAIAPFKFVSDPQTFVVSRVSALAVYGGVAFGLWRGFLEIDRRMHVVLAGMLALVLLLPEHLLGIWGLHFRFGPAFVVLLGASLRFRDSPGRAPAAATAVIVAILALQLHNGWTKVAHTDAYLGALRGLLAEIPEGAKVLQSFDRDAPVWLGDHAGALAVIENDAYVATLFTNTSPVGVAPAWRPIHLPAGWRFGPGLLAYGADKTLPPAVNGAWSEDYYFDWPRQFTHVLHIKAGAGGSAPEIPEACLLAENRFQALFATGSCDASAQ